MIELDRQIVLDTWVLHISTWLHQHGRKVGHNDRWIAATATALDAVVLTGDSDFDPLHPDIITREFIDPAAIVKKAED